MLNDDLTFIGGGIPKVGAGTNVAGTTDIIHKQYFPDFSELDPYFWMFGKNAPTRVSDIKIDAGTKSALDMEIAESSADKEVLLPTLANISDSEIRVKALDLIKSLKDSEEPFEVSAILNTLMDNFGLGEDENAKKIFYNRLKQVLKPSQTISDAKVNEDNSALVGKEYDIPKSALSNIENALRKCRKEGIECKNMQFAVNALERPKISYSNMKRKLGIMKAMDRDGLEYQLYGGNDMLKFLKGKLESERASVESRKSALDKTVQTNNHIKTHTKSALPSYPKINEGYEFMEDDFVGYTDDEYVPYLDLGKLPVGHIKWLLKNAVMPHLQKNPQFLDAFNSEVATSNPSTATDWATIMDAFDICIAKFSQEGGRYKCYIPSKMSRIKDFGDGYCMLSLRNAIPQFTLNESHHNDKQRRGEEEIRKATIAAIGKDKYSGEEEYHAVFAELERRIESEPNNYWLKLALDMVN